MLDQEFTAVLQSVEVLYQDRLRSYAIWTRALPLVGGVLALVPAFVSANGYILTLAIWGVLWIFRSYHTWKLARLVSGPIVGVCGQVEEVGSHGRGHRRSDGLVYPIALDVWFEGALPVRRSEAAATSAANAAATDAPVDSDSEQLSVKSDHWYRQLERTELDRPHSLIIEMSRLLSICRRHSETHWLEGSLLRWLVPGEVVGMIVMADGTVAAVLTGGGAVFPRFMPVDARSPSATE